MNVRIVRLVVISGWIAVGCLFSPALRANEDLKLPNSQTVIKADINGNGTPDRIVASYLIRPVLVVDDFKANTCKTVPGKFVRYTMYADGQKKGKVIIASQSAPNQIQSQK
jgi:hypothetical protein